MDARELELQLKSILAGSGYTITSLVKQLNEKGIITTVQNVSNKLKRGSLNYLEVVDMLKAIGYDIEWVKRK
ncbi:MAG: DUF6471 domain-containing protein [Candidatus Gastranaerophilales bacterium]|nr:DUF6471 domain-containing protein [Candidatus Gastranaerophilales bacterium]